MILICQFTLWSDRWIFFQAQDYTQRLTKNRLKNTEITLKRSSYPNWKQVQMKT